MYEVWIDTRVNREVVQYVYSRHDDRFEARELVNKINTNGSYRNMVAWVEFDECSDPTKNTKPALKRFYGTKSTAPNNKAKLNLDIARAIRRRVANGEMKSALAREYDVDPSAISHIIKGTRWPEPGRAI